MKTCRLVWILSAIAVLLMASRLPAQRFLQLGAPFGEHMVLQQGATIPIWGSGCPGGDTVRALLNGQTRSGRCDWKGDWMVEFAPMMAGGPYQFLMEVGGYGPLVPNPAATSRSIEFNDVLIGEVVLASVNSGPTLSATRDGAKEIAGAKYPWIRMHTAPGRWAAVSPSAVNGFSADSYFLARALYSSQKVPVGVVDRPDGTLCSPLQTRVAPQYCGARLEPTKGTSSQQAAGLRSIARSFSPGGDWARNPLAAESSRVRVNSRYSWPLRWYLSYASRLKCGTSIQPRQTFDHTEEIHGFLCSS